MSYIFLDESGDLGFDFSKSRTSSYFLITILFSPNRASIEKIVKHTHTNLKKKHKQKGGVLHAYREKPITRQRLLGALAKKDVKVLCIRLNKRKVYTRMQNEKAVLYNYVVNILLDRILTKKLIPLDKQITLIASRKETNQFLNLNFKAYLQERTFQNHKLPLKIEVKTPHEEKALQAVDFVSWAIFRKYEKGDEFYYQLFKDIVFEDSPLFP